MKDMHASTLEREIHCMVIILTVFEVIINTAVYSISHVIFFQAWERAESSKSCNLIGSESGLYFMILLTNPNGIVGSIIQKFVCC